MVSRPRAPDRSAGDDCAVTAGLPPLAGDAMLRGSALGAQSNAGAQHCWYLMPEPHGHGSLRPGLGWFGARLEAVARPAADPEPDDAAVAALRPGPAAPLPSRTAAAAAGVVAEAPAGAPT